MASTNTIIFDYTCLYYKRLREAAQLEDVHGTQVPVFRGSVTRVFRDMAISQSYYSRIKKALTEMGCMTALKQGSRNVDSVIVLHHEPTEEGWENFSEKDLTVKLDAAILSQRLQDVIESIGGLNVKKALADHEVRIANLEREVERLGKVPTAKRRSAG